MSALLRPNASVVRRRALFLSVATLCACNAVNPGTSDATSEPADGVEIPTDAASSDALDAPDLENSPLDADAPSSTCRGGTPTDLTVLFDRYFARRA